MVTRRFFLVHVRPQLLVVGAIPGIGLPDRFRAVSLSFNLNAKVTSHPLDCARKYLQKSSAQVFVVINWKRYPSSLHASKAVRRSMSIAVGQVLHYSLCRTCCKRVIAFRYNKHNLLMVAGQHFQFQIPNYRRAQLLLLWSKVVRPSNLLLLYLAPQNPTDHLANSSQSAT